MGIEELRGISLFDSLTDGQLERLAAQGAVSEFHQGDELWHEGDRADVWWVLMEGVITLLRHVGPEETVMGALSEPGQWAGGFAAWDEFGIYLATGRAAGDGRIFRLDADRLRALSLEWFALGVHFIQGFAHTVRRVEATARQRESLIALGTLAAGLAHELNNPASAATRAVDALATTSESMFGALGRLADAQLTAEQFLTLDRLRQDLDPGAAPADALATADLEDELSAWLRAHDVEQEWLLAPSLAAAGADIAWCERMAEDFSGPALAAGLGWVADSVSMAQLLSEVKESTRRVSALVARVRTYSQLDRASLQSTDVTEGLDSTLVMLGHKLGDGITVERDYSSDVPVIEAMPAELNQVWTNLIDNAVDAMDGSGTLRLSTRVDDLGWVVVEVADTGAGMSEETAKRIFEPFFTTKPVGVGTGLGLDISWRIVVERHHGEISVESRPGRTVFRVRLPVR